MRIRLSILFACLSLSLAAGERAKTGDGQTEWNQLPKRLVNRPADAPVPKANSLDVVPHLSANGDWKSAVLVRNNLDFSINLIFEFYDEYGDPAQVYFDDSDGQSWVGNGFDFFLAGREVFALDFDIIEGGYPSFQIFAYSEANIGDYSIETVYSRYDRGTKTASVGVQNSPDSTAFSMNMDERFDPFTGYQKFRGLALTNGEHESCRCTAYLYDDGRGGVNLDGPVDIVDIDLPARAKWVGLLIDLFPDIDNLLPVGFGYMDVECDRYVSALGLAFEVNSPIAASVPVEPY